MLKSLLSILLICFLLQGSLYSQQESMVVIKSQDRIKNFKYYPGDEIMLKLSNDSIVRDGIITGIRDSSFVLNNSLNIDISGIEEVYREKWFFRFLSESSKMFSLVYFGLTGINRTINKEYPVYDKESLLISISVYAAGILINQLSIRKLKVPGKWKIEILQKE